jgi:uncharacterized protein YgbK (DUF1537 family)
MAPTRLNKAKLLNSLPPEWPDDLLPEIQRRAQASRCKVIVLDDDPTGTQTVHDVPVLTEWPVDALSAELRNDCPACFLLTNSRSLPLAEAEAMNAEIGRHLVQAGQETHDDPAANRYVVVSRSDSTLRGHFPGEVRALAGALGEGFDAWLIIPFFLEGGRYTIGDVHYVAESDAAGEWLVPAGQTEFARDAAFGYRASNLRDWVEEKTGGRVRAADVSSISIDDVRRGGPRRVTERLAGLKPGSVCVVNAASYRDMEVLVLGLLAAEARGRRFLYRTAASFARTRAGIGPRTLLTCSDLNLSQSAGGLLIVGSHVPRTTVQVEALLSRTGILGIEIDVTALLDKARRSSAIQQVAEQADQALRRGEDVVVFTSRQLVTGQDGANSLAICQRISEGVVEIARSIPTRPRYLLAKGGITASDLATQALSVKRALVRGQILPGIPVWELGKKSRHPGLTYIVGPGNVGGREALVEIVEELRMRVEGAPPRTGSAGPQ